MTQSDSTAVFTPYNASGRNVPFTNWALQEAKVSENIPKKLTFS